MRFFYILLLIFNIIFLTRLTSQNSSIDSLESVFNTATTDTARLSILFKDIPFYYLGQPERMLKLYARGYELAKRYNDKARCFKGLFYSAMIYMYDKSDDGLGFIWLQKALKAAEEEGNYLSLQRVHYAMGIIYDHQGNRSEMFKNFYKSAEYGEKAPHPDASAFTALSQNLEQDGRLEEYLEINKRFVALVESKNSPDIDKLNAYNSIAEAMSKVPNDKTNYAFYSQKALSILDNLSPKVLDTPDKLLLVASIYYKFKRQDEAIKYANAVLNLSSNDDFALSSKGLAHIFLSDIYEKQKNYTQCIFHLKEYQKYELEQMRKRLTEDTGRKTIKAEAERDLLLKQKELDNHKWISIFGFLISLVLFIGGIIGYRIYKKEQYRKQELAKLNATKDRLFSIIAHDLRTPIGTLKTYLDLTDFGVMSQSDFANASQKLTNNVNALFQTLDNLLKWSYTQLKGIEAQPENINLFEIVSEEIRFLNEIAQQKNINIVNKVLPNETAFADRNQIGLVVRNIVNNALKFTYSGGKITVESDHTEGGTTVLKISDNGIGMPQGFENQLFKIESNQSRRGTMAEKGQGLGLILVKEMIEANKGSIHISSVEKQGTIVSIQLPIFRKDV